MCGTCYAHTDGITIPEDEFNAIVRGEKEPVFIVEPHPVEAGYFPRFEGNFFGSIYEKYPGLHKVPGDSFAHGKIVIKLRTETPLYAISLQDYLPGTWDALNGITVGHFAREFKRENIDGLSEESVGTWLARKFSILVNVPGYEFSLPKSSNVHIKFTLADAVHRIAIPAVLADNKDLDAQAYVFEDPLLAFNQLTAIRSQFMQPPSMLIECLDGFVFNEKTVADLPHPEGVVATHDVYIGDFRVVSGWQWAGRPLGIPGSLQNGFLRPSVVTESGE